MSSTRLKKPISDKAWLDKNSKWNQILKYTPEKLLMVKKNVKYYLGNGIKGNVIQIGAVRTFSLYLYTIATNLTIVDYSDPAIKASKGTFTKNSYSTKNVTFVTERMEKYSKLKSADYILFTFSMSFSSIPDTIKNLDNNCKVGCKIIIIETLKSLLNSLRTDFSKKELNDKIKWKNNILLIEKLFKKNSKWKLTKKEIKTNEFNGLPNLILHYVKITL